jgi:acyl carrier protein
MALITPAIEAEITEVICEIIDVEPFEMSPKRLFIEHYGAGHQQTLEILATLQSAFGVRIDPTQLAKMANLAGVVEVVSEALTAKRATRITQL